MRLPFPLRGRKPQARPTVKFKPRATLRLPDLLSTSFVALKESADAFPPLKGAVGGVLALWDIAQRAESNKSEACNIAIRAEEILDIIAQAVPDASAIPAPMLQSIERFTALLHDIRPSMEKIAGARGFSRIRHLNRNERTLQRFKSQLDYAYRDLLAASALRVEVQQAEMAAQQIQLAAQQEQLVCQQRQIHNAVTKVATFTDTFALQPPLMVPTDSHRFSTSSTSTFSFFGQPLNDLSFINVSVSVPSVTLITKASGTRGTVWFSPKFPSRGIGRESIHHQSKSRVRAGIG
ncbi:hypothetical protein GGX14DRAFT_470137, partial [Mycena pura]